MPGLEEALILTGDINEALRGLPEDERPYLELPSERAADLTVLSFDPLQIILAAEQDEAVRLPEGSYRIDALQAAELTGEAGLVNIFGIVALDGLTQALARESHAGMRLSVGQVSMITGVILGRSAPDATTEP